MKSRDEKNKSRKEEKGRKNEFQDDSHFWPDEIKETDVPAELLIEIKRTGGKKGKIVGVR